MTHEEQIIKEDKRLDALVRKHTDQANLYTMKLDGYRWEQVMCPDGPQYSQREYAALVGVDEGAIRRSVRAWTHGADRAVRTCGLGAPHPKEADQPSGDTIDTGDRTPEDHARARLVSRFGEAKTLVAEAIAAEWSTPTKSLAASTVALNEPHKNRRARTLELAEELAAGGDVTAEIAAAAAKQAHDEETAEAARVQALRDLIPALLAEHGLDHGPKDVNALWGSLTEPPTEADVREAVAAEVRKREIGQKMEQNRKANEAAESAHPAWVLEIVAVAVAMAQAGERERAKIKGDPKALVWNEESVALLMAEVDKVQTVVDWLRYLPTADAVTPEAIIGGGQ